MSLMKLVFPHSKLVRYRTYNECYTQFLGALHWLNICLKKYTEIIINIDTLFSYP